ncbi:hypothetical protein IFM89_006572 [Coptis chinensis]|uniref:Hflx-type G domain-containing protein n=1 Tax=Coptis chinensis TaxID=261450 RepID=A0A835II40_9MAGN|nr:hypothetical protein IFM89_006572 [Coptis chinensis]
MTANWLCCCYSIIIPFSTSTPSPTSSYLPLTSLSNPSKKLPSLSTSPSRKKAAHSFSVQVFSEDVVESSTELVSLPENQQLVQSESSGSSNGALEKFTEKENFFPTRPKSKVQVRKDEEEEERRFILRNGREVFAEKCYLVAVERKSEQDVFFGIEESIKELAQLADTAGLMVVGSTSQKLVTPNPRTYIGSGKVSEIKNAIHALDVETVIFDDELSAGQLRNLEKAFGGEIRVCDRTALILDIFNQRAATHEAALQVALAQMEYQLPRLTKMWTHLERQAGGQVKGMGEKQIEVDKRILRTQIGILKKELESVRKHRRQYRNRRVSVPIPVVSLVGYTNAGKSTLLNRLTGANVLAEDRLFATLDPTTRRVQMKNGKEFLLTDTVGFIQKLPTTLVAAFRATLEEISESSLLVHVVDISHPLSQQQIDAVDKVLSELDVAAIPQLIVWNKVGLNVFFFGYKVMVFFDNLAENISDDDETQEPNSDDDNSSGGDGDNNDGYGEGDLNFQLRDSTEEETSFDPQIYKVDKASDPDKLKIKANEREDVICVSALTGDGLQDFCDAVQARLKDSMVWVEALVPFDKGELLNTIHQVGVVEGTEYTEKGTLVRAHVPLPLARQLTPMRQLCAS